jgi:hypothetical protein
MLNIKASTKTLISYIDSFKNSIITALILSNKILKFCLTQRKSVTTVRKYCFDRKNCEKDSKMDFVLCRYCV